MDKEVDVKSDKIGIASAVLCSIHCLIVPVLYLVKVSWAEQHRSFTLPGWWELMDYVFMIISFTAVFHSAGHTPFKSIKFFLWTFWLVLMVSILFSNLLHWMAYIASAGLIITHFMNIRKIRQLNSVAA